MSTAVRCLVHDDLRYEHQYFLKVKTKIHVQRNDEAFWKQRSFKPNQPKQCYDIYPNIKPRYNICFCFVGQNPVRKQKYLHSTCPNTFIHRVYFNF